LTAGEANLYYQNSIAYGSVDFVIFKRTRFEDYVHNLFYDYYDGGNDIDSTYHITSGTPLIYEHYGYYYFYNYIEFETDSYQVIYKTNQKLSWIDVISAIGGMSSSISKPLFFATEILLYGCALFSWVGIAPYMPLPDDLARRMDVQIARQLHANAH